MLRWFRALLPREDKFFDLFNEHSEILIRAAQALDKLLAGGEGVEQYGREIMELETQADEVTQKVLLAVRRSFITPFDRGDIKDLVQSMDDAIDTMQKTVKTVLLFEQQHFEGPMREMGTVIVEAAKLTAEAVPLLQHIGRNSARLISLTEKVMQVEERSDELHDRGLKELFKAHGATNPMAYIIGSEIYSELEKIVDRFEDVANEISGIVIENV